MVQIFEPVLSDKQGCFTFTEYKLDQGYVDNSLHYHAETEISFVKSGSACYFINGKKHIVKQGDIIVIRSFEHHHISQVLSEEMEHLVIAADTQFIRVVNETVFEGQMMPLLLKTEDFPNVISQHTPLQQAFLRMEEQATEQARMYRYVLKCSVILILSSLIQEFYNTKAATQDTEISASVYTRINKVTEYIDRNIVQPISLNTLSEIADMNPAYLSSFFKKHTGVSVTEYILQNRISLAVKQLQSTDMPVAQIAVMCGFNTMVNFNKAFKKVIGMTPSAVRKLAAHK